MESVVKGEDEHNHEWIAKDIERVIRKSLSPVAGCTTDNAPVNRAAWDILQNTFPTLFCQGCACHALHLMVKDIFHKSDKKIELTPVDEL